MKVKVCGLTRRSDVELACELGASHVGFVLVPETPRFVSAQHVRHLAGDLPSHVEPVLVFRNPSRSFVQDAVDISGVRTVQIFHHEEPMARTFEAQGLRVHRVSAAPPPSAPLFSFQPKPGPSRIWHIDIAGGGTGRTFDWTLLGSEAPRFVFVAGGITPRTVDRLLAHDPWGIDFSSGVESCPGIKDPDRLRSMFRRIEEVTA